MEVGVAVDFSGDVNVVDKLDVGRQVLLEHVGEGQFLEVVAEVGHLRQVDG